MVFFVQSLALSHTVQQAPVSGVALVPGALQRRNKRLLRDDECIKIGDCPLDFGDQFQVGSQLVFFLDQKPLDARPRVRFEFGK
jgi:hypothetical protein